MLNYRNVKGNVKNEYRAYKMLYYAVLEAITLSMFLNHFGIDTIPDNSENFPKVPFPDNFTGMTNAEKLEWLNGVCTCIVKQWFFEDSTDICSSLHEVIDDSENPENYWISNFEST